MKFKKSIGEVIFDSFNITFLLLAAFVTLYPIWHELCLSFSSALESMKGGLFLFPRGFSLKAYQVVLESKYIASSYMNSIFVTITATFLSVILQAAIAYPLTKKGMPGQKIFLFLLIFSMIFSGGMIPNYLLIKNLGILNSLWALILPGLVSGFNVFIIISFFKNLPVELEESAFLDGATPIRIFIQIIIPLSAPVLATVALWEAVKNWNMFFNALIYINDRSKFTLPLLVNEVINGSKQMSSVESGVPSFAIASTVAATIMLVIAPILMIYPFLQRFFVKGVMIGSVKG